MGPLTIQGLYETGRTQTLCCFLDFNNCSMMSAATLRSKNMPRTLRPGSIKSRLSSRAGMTLSLMGTLCYMSFDTQNRESMLR
jgi:hypothetical protein